MIKKQLAAQLRQRQILYGTPSAAHLSDDQILFAYTTCSGCGDTVPKGLVDRAIEEAADMNDFFSLIGGACCG